MKNLSFHYLEAMEPALNNISITIKEGDFTVICGPSGCGKTTLLSLLKKEIAPAGELEGTLTYLGKALSEWDDRTLIEEIGFVFQDPDNQIIMDDVMQEMVFGMENLGYSNLEMRKRVAELVHFFGMEGLLKDKPSELSGGQKQLLNLLSVLLLKPKVLLLDEPTSQLDPVAAKNLILMLERLNKEMGMTILLVEHRLEELFAIADHVIVMDKGFVRYEGESRDIIEAIFQNNDERAIPYVPSISQLYMKKAQYLEKTSIPLTVKECRSWIRTVSPLMSTEQKAAIDRNESILSLQEVYFQYTKKTPYILKNLALEVKQGEFYTIVGGNGSGKSTLLKACIGNIKPQRGRVLFREKETSKLKGKALYNNFAYLPQNPKTYFIHDTIDKEMQEVVQQKQIDNGEEKIVEMLCTFEIEHIRHQHPYDCSGGEMQKAALACMLLGSPTILFIDEPTKGLDPLSKQHFARLLKQLHQKGLTIVMVTHDIEFAAKYAERCAMMFDGAIMAEGTPTELFQGNYFYTTSVNRATSGSGLTGTLTLEEALASWPNHVPI